MAVKVCFEINEMTDPLAGGHAGESPYRYDPAARLSLTMGYARDPLHNSRYPWWLPPRDRCAWSPEIVRERAREAEQCRQVLATIDTANARLEARDRISPHHGRSGVKDEGQIED